MNPSHVIPSEAKNRSPFVIPRNPCPFVILSVERRIPHRSAPTLTFAILVTTVLLALLAMPSAAFAQSYTDPGASGNLDDQALAIENQLQCPVCENVTVAYSNSALAGQMRQVIRDKLAQGESRDQILNYFVDRYGEGILTQPPKHGLNLLVWLLPLAGLLAGLGVLGTALLSRKATPAPASEDPRPEGLSEEDERLLARALRGS